MAYISQSDVEIRLLGKVRFTDDDEDVNRFPRKLLTRLIKEAEGQVERDVSPRYAAPFRTIAGGAFKDLPATTQETLRTMCELMAVIRVLGNDFGRGTVNDAEKFTKSQQKVYDDLLKRELAQREEGAYGMWRYPPLEGLLLSEQNSQDDGFHGVVLVTSRGEGDFPAKQITDPSENFANGVIDE